RQAGGDELHGGIAAGEECGRRYHGGDASDIAANGRAGPRMDQKQTATPLPRLLHALPPSLSRGAIPVPGSLPPFKRAAQALPREVEVACAFWDRGIAGSHAKSRAMESGGCRLAQRPALGSKMRRSQSWSGRDLGVDVDVGVGEGASALAVGAPLPPSPM